MPGSVLTHLKPKERSKETPVGVFLRGQAHYENPNYFTSIAEARTLRKSGFWYSCNAGKDIAQAGDFQRRVPEDKQKSRWQNVTYLHMGEPIGFTVKELLT